jgi:formamidopyrimidine-DNA glycosylase
MPELPEVETIVQALRQPLIGRAILEVRSDWPRHIAEPTLAEMQDRIRGLHFVAIDRRGKYLRFDLNDNECLLIHLKMSGHLTVVTASTPSDKHVHTVFSLENGDELRFRDIRKFGRVYLTRDPETVLGKLGPEPLSSSLSAEDLFRRLQKRRRLLKPLLLDQTFIAGIGNIYADEALYHARLHPQRYSHTLTGAEAGRLFTGIRKALRLGLEKEGASIDNYRKPDGSLGEMQQSFVAYGREGEPCFRCGHAMERIVLGGRSTYYCPICQELSVDSS